MDLVMGIMLGAMVVFIFDRLADRTCKEAGYDCGFNCDECTAHCAGYHCHLMRKAKAEHSNTNDAAASEIQD